MCLNSMIHAIAQPPTHGTNSILTNSILSCQHNCIFSIILSRLPATHYHQASSVCCTQANTAPSLTHGVPLAMLLPLQRL
jgi:hypothetical protein